MIGGQGRLGPDFISGRLLEHGVLGLTSLPRKPSRSPIAFQLFRNPFRQDRPLSWWKRCGWMNVARPESSATACVIFPPHDSNALRGNWTNITLARPFKFAREILELPIIVGKAACRRR
jgi:hypothetical protein